MFPKTEVLGQPPAVGFAVQAPPPAAAAAWSTGLCDCFDDCGNCLVTCLCPCITFGQIAEILDQGAVPCATSGTLYALVAAVTACHCLYSCRYRAVLRDQYGLRGSPAGDLCVHCFCEHCALCQEYRHLKNQGFDMDKGWKANVERRQWGATTATVPPPQMGQGMMR